MSVGRHNTLSRSAAAGRTEEEEEEEEEGFLDNQQAAEGRHNALWWMGVSEDCSFMAPIQYARGMRVHEREERERGGGWRGRERLLS